LKHQRETLRDASLVAFFVEDGIPSAKGGRMKVHSVNLLAAAGLLVVSMAAFAQQNPLGGSPGRSVPRTPDWNPKSRQSEKAENPNTTNRKTDSHKNDSQKTSDSEKVTEKLQQNTELAAKLQALLPAETKVQDAAVGFKNIREFAAALHASHDLEIPFDQLKAKLTAGKALHQAIHDLKPDVDAKAEMKKADKAAGEDVKSTA